MSYRLFLVFQRKLCYLLADFFIIDSSDDSCNVFAESHIWYLSFHHVIADNVARSLVFDHMSQLYGRSLRGQLGARVELPPFQAYVQWERTMRSSTAFLEANEYWTQKLSEDWEPIAFYCKTPLREGTRQETVSCDLGRERTKRLRSLAHQ